MQKPKQTHESAYARVQLARHPKRPYTIDLINAMFEDFTELAGDRRFADDSAIVAGTANFEGKPIAVIGHQKGRDTHERSFRNFGMPKPEGYRKALRVMKLAERFDRPIVTLIDTPGAYPGIDAEERGQAEAIASNLLEMAKLRVPIIAVVLGEGGSGGALAIGISDKLLMLENAVYSVISPEGCAAILWKSNDFTQRASESLRLTAQDLKGLGVVDEIIPEPDGGAHNDCDLATSNIKKVLSLNLQELARIGIAGNVGRRYAKLRKLGQWAVS